MLLNFYLFFSYLSVFYYRGYLSQAPKRVKEKLWSFGKNSAAYQPIMAPGKQMSRVGVFLGATYLT